MTRGLDVKLKLKGENFTKWFEAVVIHAKTMGMDSLLECGPNLMISSLVHDECATQDSSFESYGATPMEHVQALSQ